MIFVVLGTWEMPFVRPLVEIERAIQQGLLQPPVVVQSGNTTYASPHMELVPFYDNEDLQRMYDSASLVICQAGVGSIMLGLRKHKTVVSIARLRKFDEHIDDHQIEILHVFANLGAVLPWQGSGDLGEVLKRAEKFVPAKYPFGQERVSRAILDYLDASLHVR
jgi:UDP-N-acetylglucosamine transferase subunit ALG13